MARAAIILAEAGYDVIDLNFACPVKKIKNKARGGHMLLDVDRAVSVSASSPRRCIRSPADRQPAPRFRRLRRNPAIAFSSISNLPGICGFAAIRVHGRTVEQKYLGRLDAAFLARTETPISQSKQSSAAATSSLPQTPSA